MRALASLPRLAWRRSVLVLLMLSVIAVASGVALRAFGKGRIRVGVSGRDGRPVKHVQLLVDGTRVQCVQPPCVLVDQAKGTHVLEVLAENFATSRPQRIEVRAWEQALVSFVLDPLPSLGLKVGGTQPDVVLSVDGREIGALPQEVHGLEVGSHKITLSGGDAYRALERTVDLEPGKLTDLGVLQLKVLIGRLTILPGPLAADRVRLVHGAEGYDLHQLPTTRTVHADADWQIIASKSGFLDYVRRVEFEDGVRDRTYTVTFERSYGELALPRIDHFQVPPIVASPTPVELNGAQIQATSARYAPSIRRACWGSALATRDADAGPFARVQVAILIAADGGVQSVVSRGDPPGYHGLSDCIVRRVKTWQFPASSGSTTVNVPFVYAIE